MYWQRQLSERASSDCLLKYLYATTLYTVSSLDIWCPRLSLHTLMKVTFWYLLSGTSDTKEALSQQLKCLYNLNLDLAKTPTQFSVSCPWIGDNFLLNKDLFREEFKSFLKGHTQQSHFYLRFGFEWSDSLSICNPRWLLAFTGKFKSRMINSNNTHKPTVKKDNYAINFNRERKTSSFYFHK